jgi:hypothetical protein
LQSHLLCHLLWRQRLGLQFKASLGKTLMRPSLNNKQKTWWHIPVMLAITGMSRRWKHRILCLESETLNSNTSTSPSPCKKDLQFESNHCCFRICAFEEYILQWLVLLFALLYFFLTHNIYCGPLQFYWTK